jgi:hypothetical protein
MVRAAGISLVAEHHARVVVVIRYVMLMMMMKSVRMVGVMARTGRFGM